MPDYRDFDNVKLFTVVNGTLINKTPLRVGVGKEPPLGAPVDIAVYRVNGIPCIPGSSLKGVFRTFIELLAASQGNRVHDPWDKDKIEKEAENNDFCLICGIFGSTAIASHIRIHDAYPKNRTAARTFIKYGIGIDRVFGGAKPGFLFTEELIEPGTEWLFRMDVINIKILPEPDPNDKRAGLVKRLLDTLTKPGLSVGARRSVGCGLIKLKEGEWSTYLLKDGEFKLLSKGVLK